MSSKTMTKNWKRTADRLNFRSWWSSKSPVFRFLLGFAVVIIAFYLLYYSSFYTNNYAAFVEGMQAHMASAMLNLLGYDTQVAGDIISGAGQSVSISKGCDGLEPMALFVGAILVFPISFKWKWPGLVAGIAGLFFLNNFRIIGLYMVGVHIPKWFEPLHLHGGFVIYTIMSILIWFIWAAWALKKQRNSLDKST